MSKKAWCFETSFTWKSVALLKFPFKTWSVVKNVFQNLTRCKVSDTKMTGCLKLTKNLLLLKVLIRIWRIVENFFQDLIFCKSPARKTVFFSNFFFKNCWFSGNAWLQIFFGVKRSKNIFLKAKVASKSAFLKKTISLQNLTRCKSFFFEIWNVPKYFDSNFAEL